MGDDHRLGAPHHADDFASTISRWNQGNQGEQP